MKKHTYPGLFALVIAAAFTVAAGSVSAQRGGGPPAGPGGAGGRGAAVDPNLPTTPAAVALPTFKEVTGPGAMYDSSPAQWPGYDMKHFNYEMKEYFVSGTAAGIPYTTRLVIRKPAGNGRSSGIVVAEPMHPIGGAHAFEYNSVYIMDSAHVAAEIATTGLNNFQRFNAERYKDLKVENRQSNEILAQVGALVRSVDGPLAGQAVRKMVLWGTSASSGIVAQYLPASPIYKTPQMGRIYDGFMPTSNGAQINPVDVPIIQVPTQHEYAGRHVAAGRRRGRQAVPRL